MAELGGLICRRVMPEPKPHPLNVDGPFYVADGCCICCDLPRALAPDMFKFNEANDHCYAFSQPETEDQLRRMVEAVASAELACIRYRGHEKHVLRLLKKKGCGSERSVGPQPA
jgi:hypothetical protein